MPQVTRILAVDPGYDRIGIAVISKDGKNEELVFSECFLTDKNQSHDLRLGSIGKEINRCIELYKPTDLAIEKLFFNKNVKTALAVAEARGVILGQAASRLSVFEYSPQDIKIAVTGYGNSSKKQVTEMVKKLLNIKMEIRFDDEYDAIAIGLTHAAINKPTR